MSKRPETLSVTECHQLLDHFLNPRSQNRNFDKGVRNYTMTLLMLDAGLRVQEVTKLKISDCIIQGQVVKTLHIRKEVGKGHRERMLPLSERIQKAFGEMHKRWWIPNAIHTIFYAFPSGYNERRMSVRQVERIIKDAGLKSIGRPVNPHMLRHTFATRLMRQVNSRVVQELLGHKNIQTTQIYTHPNHDDLQDAIKRIES
ncbi:tyrosine-type recombinase/integrase [Candidatus Pacearchaeota archaeon]|nr:tyrosine-type recombinase/integrase [Candidatus Pacearchaeota archaeon]